MFIITISLSKTPDFGEMTPARANNANFQVDRPNICSMRLVEKIDMNKLNQVVKILEYANGHFTRGIILVLFITSIASLLDFFSLSLLFPVLVSFLDLHTDLKIPFSELLSKINFQEALIIIIITYFFKSLFLSFASKYNLSYIYRLKREISYSIYLNKFKDDYLEGKKNNSSNFVNIISSEVNLFSNYVLEPTINGINESILILLGILFIIYVDPKIIVVASLFFILYFIFYKLFIKSKISNLSETRRDTQNKIVQHTQETASLIKEILIFKKETNFIAKFKEINNQFISSNLDFHLLQGIPKIWIEFLIIILITTIVTVLKYNNYEKSDIIVVMSVLSVFSFKLFPGLNRLINHFQAIRFGLPSIESIYKNIKPYNIKILEKSKKLSFEDKILIDNVSYIYPERCHNILSNVNLLIKKGQFINIVGQSGSGKSTLIDLLLGVIKPTAGDIKSDEISIYLDLQKWFSYIGYVPQSVNLLDDDFIVNIAMCFSNDLVNFQKIEDSIRKAGLSDFVNSLPSGLYTKLGENGRMISGGQKQRLGIARALYHNSKIIILDEPTSSLDSLISEEIMTTIKSLTPLHTVVMITHNLDLNQYADEVYVLHDESLTKM